MALTIGAQGIQIGNTSFTGTYDGEGDPRNPPQFVRVAGLDPQPNETLYLSYTNHDTGFTCTVTFNPVGGHWAVTPSEPNEGDF